MKINFNRIIIPSEKDKIINLFTQFIQCKICMNILNDPIDCICCNQTFCRSCIQNYIKTNNKCPYQDFFSKNNQKKKSILENLKPSSINFSKFIQSLKFYCKNKKNGCNEALSIEEISEHDKVCKYRKVIHINSKNNFLIDDSDIFVNLSNCEGKNHNNYFSLFKDQMNKKKKTEQNNLKINYNQDNSNVSFKPIESNNQNSCVNTNSNTNSNNNSHFNLNNYENINNYFTSTPYFKQSNFYSNEKIYKLIEEINSKISTFLDDQKKNDINFDKNKHNLNNDTYIKAESESTRFTSPIFKEKNETYNSNLYIGNSPKKESTKIRNHKSTCKFNYNLKKNKSLCSPNEINFKKNHSNEKVKIIKNSKSNDNVSEDNKTERISEPIIMTEGNNIKSTQKLRIKVIPKSKRKKNINTNSNDDKNNYNNNEIINENEITSVDLYKEIINYMKKLDDKINNIENLLQNKERIYSVKSFILSEEENKNKPEYNNKTFHNEKTKNSEGNIKHEKKIKNNIYKNNNYYKSQGNLIKKEKNKISKTVDEEPITDMSKNKNDDFEKIVKELFLNIEDNFNKKISEKFNEFQKYLGDSCMNDIRNAILDVNLDVMNLYTEKFDNIENILTNNNSKKNKK
jgi:hypothetical protein